MENNKWILKEDSVNETTYKDFDFSQIYHLIIMYQII